MVKQISEDEYGRKKWEVVQEEKSSESEAEEDVDSEGKPIETVNLMRRTEDLKLEQHVGKRK